MEEIKFWLPRDARARAVYNPWSEFVVQEISKLKGNDRTLVIIDNFPTWHTRYILDQIIFYKKCTIPFRIDFIITAKSLDDITYSDHVFFDFSFSSLLCREYSIVKDQLDNETSGSKDKRGRFLVLLNKDRRIILSSDYDKMRVYKSKGYHCFTDYYNYQLVFQKSPLWCNLFKDLKVLLLKRHFVTTRY